MTPDPIGVGKEASLKSRTNEQREEEVLTITYLQIMPPPMED